MTNPMTAEEALQSAAAQYTSSQSWCDGRSMSEILASLGYALHPIKIDETAVNQATDARFRAIFEGLSVFDATKAAVTAYHEALARKP